MLFSSTQASSSLPPYVLDLLDTLDALLRSRLPAMVHSIAFDQGLARQVILNLYPPGQGISPHIDLPNRYADGIVGVSLVGGCCMTFTKESEIESETARHQVYLPPRTVYVLTGEARWDWAHGIEARDRDIVSDDSGGQVTLLRDTRVSVTFRWMKEGGHVLA